MLFVYLGQKEFPWSPTVLVIQATSLGGKEQSTASAATLQNSLSFFFKVYFYCCASPGNHNKNGSVITA
jgi:hypothetical protein